MKISPSVPGKGSAVGMGMAPLGPQPFPDLTHGGRDTDWAGAPPALRRAPE